MVEIGGRRDIVMACATRTQIHLLDTATLELLGSVAGRSENVGLHVWVSRCGVRSAAPLGWWGSCHPSRVSIATPLTRHHCVLSRAVTLMQCPIFRLLTARFMLTVMRLG